MTKGNVLWTVQLENTTKPYLILLLLLSPVTSRKSVLTLGFKYQQKVSQRERQDEQFLKWLSPSYWLVEAQLHSVREQRGSDTLQWARDMPEFQSWRTSDNRIGSKERILWIRGTLGVGKTIMAGYFIDLLQCLYPDAIVAYFFCRSGQAGLTKARDLVRTLAYQCIEGNPEGRLVLEALQRKDFQIDDSIGVAFLFEKLVRGLLNRTTKDIHIIIDGLDEADCTAKDATERKPTTEINVLLKCLASLPSVRLLLISRPHVDITRVIPCSTTKSLGKDDNMDDIDRYVQNTLDSSDRLRIHFDNESIDAKKYFHEKTNGIFLWVVIVLHQLAQTKSSSMFRKYLNGFSDASGDMERLYSSVLSRIGDEDRKWIKEILKWLVVAQRGILVDELREAVEWSLQDKLPEFQSYLEVECGSMLHLIATGISGPSRVQLIHETLRSFLVNSECCSTEFYVAEDAAHFYALGVCLDFLSISKDSIHFSQYASEQWTSHLEKTSTSDDRPFSLLFSLHRFFNSHGCKRWVHRQIHRLSHVVKPHHQAELHVRGEEWALKSVYIYLKGWEGCEQRFDSIPQKSKEIEAVLKWRSEVLRKPRTLGDYVGRAAAELWLLEDLSWSAIESLFRLALKYYWKAHNPRMDDIDELKVVAANNFAGILAWSRASIGVLKKKNLAVGFFMLRLWSDAAICLQSLTDADDSDGNRWAYLGEAYLRMGQYDNAIQAFTKEHQKVYIEWDDPFIQTYRAKHDIDGIIHTLTRDDLPMRDRKTLLELGNAYANKGDFDREIKLYEEGVEKNANEWWAWQFLTDAYMRNGELKEVVHAWERAKEQNPDEQWASVGLRNSEKIMADPHWRNNRTENRRRFGNILYYDEYY